MTLPDGRQDLIQLRRDVTADWALVDPILAPGEPGWDSTSKVLKIGDGATPWSTLPPALEGAYLAGLGTTTSQTSPADLIFTNTTYLGDNGTRIYITPKDHVTTGVGGVIKVFGDPFQDDQVDYRDLGIYFSADQAGETGFHGRGVFWINSKVGNASIYAHEEPDIAFSFHDGQEIGARFVKLGDGTDAGLELERAVMVIGAGLPEYAPANNAVVLEVQGEIALDTDALRWKSTTGAFNSLLDLSGDKFAVTLRAQVPFSAHYLSAGGARGVLVAGSAAATAAADDIAATLLVTGNLIFDNTADRKVRWYDAAGPINTANSLNLGQTRFGVSVSNAEYFAVKNGGSVVIGPAGALLTTADRGFLEMPQMPGTPTGVPTQDANKTTLVVDTTGSKLWAYIGGAWKSVTFA